MPATSNNNNKRQRRLFDQDLNILYDSQCNVCRWEIDFLRRRDERLHGRATTRLRFTDLEGLYDETDPANGGITYAQALQSMHAVTHDGQILQGVPVFVRAYQAVGLGWLWRITTWPVISWLANRLYDIFAKYRTRFTRGATMDALIEAYKQKRQLQQQQQACDTGRCSVPSTTTTTTT